MAVKQFLYGALTALVLVAIVAGFFSLQSRNNELRYEEAIKNLEGEDLIIKDENAAAKPNSAAPSISDNSKAQEPITQVQKPSVVTPAPSASRGGTPNADGYYGLVWPDRHTTIPPALQNAKLTDAIRKELERPILSVCVTGTFFNHIWDPRQAPPTCSYWGVKLNCHRTTDRKDQKTADMLVFHYPDYVFEDPNKERGHPKQKMLLLNMESYVRFRIDDATRKRYDLEMTYEQNSQIPIPYITLYDIDVESMFEPPRVPLEKQKHAMVFLNKNCMAENGRQEIMQRFRDIQSRKSGSVQFVGLGSCLYTGPGPMAPADKKGTFAEFKFCITFENSNIHDYISEKIWQGFEAGCIPIYWGAPNIEEYLPGPKSALIYDPGKYTPETFMELVDRIGNDPKEHAEYHAWRKLPFEQRPPGFQRIMLLRGPDQEGCKRTRDTTCPCQGWEEAACKMCQYIAEQRVRDMGIQV